MMASLIIAIICCVMMTLSVLFFPQIRLGKVSLSTYWIVTVVAALLLFAIGEANFKTVGEALIADTAINPLKILVLFISMTVISIFLDELGFFGVLASKVLKHAHTGQMRLFFCLYVVVSILTVFTSNDIIILSFTPFICYFAKSAGIKPTPYLAAEFVAANTCSMALIIGNPTNIYLATAFGIDFLTYLKVSVLPTVFAGVVALGALFLLFFKQLKAPITGVAHSAEMEDKPLLIIGIVHLAACTVLLAISSYIHVEMYLIAVCALGSLIVCTLITSLIRHKAPVVLKGCLKRTPFALIPFVLSMFAIVIVLSENGVTQALCNALGSEQSILTYGLSSFAMANLINNIPMSVLYSQIISCMGGGKAALGALYATIVGSNIGAYFTPIGALAGIMFSSILSSHGVKFGYKDFLKIGVTVAIPALFAALGALYIVI